MKHTLLSINIAFFILVNANSACFADSRSLAPATPSSYGEGGNTAPQITLAIQQDPSLPAEAKHINAIYKNGTIILQGTVATDRDRQKISSIAEKSGAQNISNEIVVKNNVGKIKLKPRQPIQK